MDGGRAGAVEGPIEVGGDDGTVVAQLARGGGPLRPGDAGVGDEDVEAAVEVTDRGFDSGGDGVVAGYVDLVCFGC